MNSYFFLVGSECADGAPAGGYYWRRDLPVVVSATAGSDG